jgi:hypothetical protein
MLIGNHVRHCILEGWFYFLELEKFEIDLFINLLGDIYNYDEIEKPLCLLSKSHMSKVGLGSVDLGVF